MNVIPLIRKEKELKISKDEFIFRLKELTESDFHFLDSAKNNKTKEYARESGDTYFDLWKIQRSHISSSFIFTIIHCHILEIENISSLVYAKNYI